MPRTLQKPEITQGFLFRESDHMYFYDGRPMTGITTALSVINKPSLIQWAANEACSYVKENLKNIDDLEVILKEARLAHRRKKEDAATKGTDVHAFIETIVKSWIETNDGKAAPLSHENEQVVKFVDWAVLNNVRFLESEKQMYSSTYWIAGTCDFTAEIKGKKFVGDIKTTSGIYDLTPFMQCAAYRLMLEEMGEKDFIGSIIVRLGKDGSFETKERFDYETDKKGFLAALELYRAMETY